MKIAILFSGHIRSYEKTRENIFSNLIEPLKNQGHVCHIFTSTWNNSGFRETNWSGNAERSLIFNDSILYNTEVFDRSKFINLYNNDKWKKYSHLSGPETCGDAVSMWYKIWRCFNLIDNSYEIVIRIRPDIWFKSKFDGNFIANLAPNTVYMAQWHGKYDIVTHKMMDHFSYGDFNSMKIYCSVYLDVANIINRNDAAFTGEGFLYSHLKHNNIHIQRDMNIKYGIMRSNKLENVT